MTRLATDALLSFGLLATSGLAQTIDGLSSTPDASDFLRRWTPNAIVIGDYLYIDSGEVSQTIGGEPLPYRHSNPVNETLSINLAESWSPEAVPFNHISKDAPKMMHQALLMDGSSNAFYIWGGQTSYEVDIPEANLWKFQADGKGGGSWSSGLPENSGDFTELRRTARGAYASTPDAAFIFGGGSWWYTDPNFEGAVLGFLEFNFTTNIWTNHSSGPFSEGGGLRDAAAVHVPTFGPNGLVMILGGADPLAPGGDSYISMQNVSFMDPVTKKWHWEVTSGSAPPSRQWHCAVGVESANNTFEIFVYGGRNFETDTSYDDMHILSLPGFVWRRAQYPSRNPRGNHACVVAGKRQMVSIGGLDPNLEAPDSWDDKDSFPQGFGIFDLVDLEWKESFDADAAEYRTPGVIQSWYDDGGLDDMAWSSDEVKALFVSESPPDESGSGQTPPTGGDNNNDDSGSSSPPVGAIAGGVVGGVLAIALIGGLVWFLLRRRRRKTEMQNGAETAHGDNLKSKYQSSELHSDPSLRAEAYGTPVHAYELPVGASRPVELDASQQR